MKSLVIYHANCWDGFCAAWVAKRALGDIEAMPASYGQPAPDVDGRDVYVLDFSYPRPEMIRLMRQARILTVLDHHKTAQAALSGITDQHNSNDLNDPVVTFDMGKSGGRLTWEYFHPKTDHIPWLVNYTEDRDMWWHKLEHSQEVNAALRSYPLDFDLWDKFEQRPFSEFVTEGKAIRRREQQIVADHLRHARLNNFDGTHTVPIVNATVLFSEIAGELAKGHPFAACYFDRQDGKRQWSLRSEETGVDVSEIAKAHGGGGHTHAAGFEEML